VGNTIELDKDMLLELAGKLSSSLQADDEDGVIDAMAKISGLHESNLFNELGKLTREFHDALNTFRYDDRIATLAEDDIPDAKERLSYVIEKTDNAAHKTLTAVENTIPLCENQCERLNVINDKWGRFTKREMTPKEFRQLSRDLEVFFPDAVKEMDEIKNYVTEVLMAQDFQDLTGQIIKRVITLVDEVEKSLVNLVKLGGGMLSVNESEKGKGSQPGELAGPQIPGMETEDVVASQDDVDELLSSLGF